MLTLGSWTSIIDTTAGLWGSILFLTGLLVGAVRWMRRIYKHIALIGDQFRPNGGSTLSDAILRIETRQVLQDGMGKFALNISSMACYECDVKGRVVWVNNALSQLFGYAKEDFLENGWLRALRPTDRATVLGEWMNSIKNQIPYEASYIVTCGETGASINVRSKAYPISDENGVALRYFGTIEELKKAS